MGEMSEMDDWRPARVRPRLRLLLWLGLPLALLLLCLSLQPSWALYLLLAYLSPFAFVAFLATLICPLLVLTSRYGSWKEQEEKWERAEQKRQGALAQMLEEEQAQRGLEAELESLARWDGYVPHDLLARPGRD